MEDRQSAEFIKKMQGLYLEGLAVKINNLNRLFLQCKRDPTDREVIAELFRETNALVGSGGSFGFPLISRAADLMRSSLKRVQEHEIPVDEILLTDLAEFIGTLQKMIDTAKQGNNQVLEAYPWLRDKISEHQASGLDGSFKIQGGDWKVFIITSGTRIAEEIQIYLIKSGIQVHTSKNTVTIMVELRDFNPDVIILDVGQSAITSKEVCEVIRLENLFDTIPIIIISDEAEDEDLMDDESDLSKVVDIVSRNIPKSELLIKVGAYLAHSKITRSLTHRDPLTGLYNYRFFHESSNHVFQTAKQNQKAMTIALIEVSECESTGKYPGNVMDHARLKLVAQLFMDNLRQSDIIARYSGGRLGIIMPDTKPSDAFRVLSRLRKQGTKTLVIQLGFPENGGYPGFIAGIAGYPDHGEHVGCIVQKAESALQEAVFTNGIVLSDR